MNLKNLSLSLVAAVAALVGSQSANAQFSINNGGFNVGVGGGYSRTTLPNGQSITNSNINWGVGIGGSSSVSTLPYYGGYAAPAVMPYYGGGCYPAPVYYGGCGVIGTYSPFTRTYGGVCYTPQMPPCLPIACTPQYPVW